MISSNKDYKVVSGKYYCSVVSIPSINIQEAMVQIGCFWLAPWHDVISNITCIFLKLQAVIVRLHALRFLLVSSFMPPGHIRMWPSFMPPGHIRVWPSLWGIDINLKIHNSMSHDLQRFLLTNIEASAVLGTSWLLNYLIYLIVRQILCGNYPKPLTIKYSPPAAATQANKDCLLSRQWHKTYDDFFRSTGSGLTTPMSMNFVHKRRTEYTHQYVITPPPPRQKVWDFL